MTAGLNSPSIHLEEQLREALVSLEQATARERQTRLETEFLLESLRELGFSDRAEEVYQKSLTILRASVTFDEAFILRQSFGGEPLNVVASTHPRFEPAKFAMSPHFSRVKAGTVVPVFNIAAVTDWQDQPETVRKGVVSTLSVPVPQETGLVAIVCTSPEKGAFNAVSTTAAQRFGLLVSQALRMTRMREDELQSALVRLSSQAERDQTDFVLAAVDSLGEGVYVVDENNRIVVTNERYRQIYHPFADHYIPGINIKTIWQQEYESGFIVDPGAGPLPDGPAGEAMVAAEMNPSTWARTIRTRRQRLQDGRTIRATDRRLPNGWTVGVRFDISEVVQNEHDLTLARNEAEAANAVKTEFLATVSHEIRTPLNAILGMLGLIRRDPLSEDQREYIGVAETSARNLLILLNDILDVSKMEAGKLTLEDQQVILEQLLQEVVRLYSDAAAAKSLSLNSHIDPALPFAVRADAGRLRQVLINLTSNAIKFTETGHIDLSIRLAERDPGADDRAILRFEVSDTGPGIDPDAQTRLFEPFEQIGAAVEKRQGGTGLGLNICRRIAEAMGGTMGLDTKPGLGSTFWMEVELETTNTASPGRQDKQAIETADLNALSAHSGKTLRILFADDSPSNQLLIRAMLQPTGHQIDIVFNGLEAVRALETLPYDLAFLDISMPEMDGREALAEVLSRQRRRRLARQHNRPDIAPLPIIALTANVMSGDRESYLADGFTEVISKPFEERDLLEAILRYGPAPEDRETFALGGEVLGEAHGVDLEALDQLAERLGEGFTQTSVQIFTEEINQRLDVLEQASVVSAVDQHQGLEHVSREAHAIKGAAASYGLMALSATAADLEAEPGRLAQALPELRRHWHRGAEALNSWALQRKQSG
jgi:signal transduction histidine kinase/HPt (histidine-containing phosphotransfer) domain-containing protein